MTSQSELDVQNKTVFNAFICYAYEDKEWVQRLVSHLESPPYNLRCCNHDRDFEAGQTTITNIKKHIQASEKFILIITPSFNRSKWCEYERDLILSLSMSEQQRTVIPVVLIKCNVPFHLSHLTYVQASWTFEEDWFDKITKALNVQEICCSVCYPEGKNIMATTRCADCKAAFCTHCNVQHGRMPVSKTHKTTPLRNEYKDFKYKLCEDHVEFQNASFRVAIWHKSIASPEMGASSVLSSLEVDERFRQMEVRLKALETGKSPKPEVVERSHIFPIGVTNGPPLQNTLMTPQSRVADESQRRKVELPNGPSSLLDGGQKKTVLIQPMGSDSDD